MSEIEKELRTDQATRVARDYDRGAFLQLEIAKRLLEKANTIKAAPSTIVDLGAGTGIMSQLLANKFPESEIIAVDGSEQMCAEAMKKQGFKTICADFKSLPLSDWACNAIYSNLMLQWVTEHSQVFSEVNRVLSSGGFFIFSTFGPDTMLEAKQAWAKVDEYKPINDFADMQHTADLLAKQGMIDVVVSREIITVKYSNPKNILKDLKNLGATNATAMNKCKGWLTKSKVVKFLKHYEEFKLPDGTYPLTYEVIYGIGWAKDKTSAAREHIIPVDHLRKMMNRFNDGQK